MRSLKSFFCFAVDISEGILRAIGITKVYVGMTKENKPKKERKFTAYPTRGFTCSDEVWEKLLEKKLKSEKTWTKFLEELLHVKEV